MLFYSCTSPAFFREQIAIPEQVWSNDFHPEFNVEIPSGTSSYTVKLILRHNATYKYRNFFVWIKEIDPQGKSKTFQVEIPLNSRDGRWLGSGSGSIYVREVTLFDKRQYTKKGEYQYILSQNMQEKHIQGLTDIGIEIQPVL